MSAKQKMPTLEDKLLLLKKEYNKKKRKLKRCQKAAKARAYVQQRLQEEAARTLNMTGATDHLHSSLDTDTMPDLGEDSRDLNGSKPCTVERSAEARHNRNSPNRQATSSAHSMNPTTNSNSTEYLNTCITDVKQSQVTGKDTTEDNTDIAIETSPGSQDIFISPQKETNIQRTEMNENTCNKSTPSKQNDYLETGPCEMDLGELAIKSPLNPQDLNSVSLSESDENVVFFSEKSSSVKQASRLKLSKCRKNNITKTEGVRSEKESRSSVGSVGQKTNISHETECDQGELVQNIASAGIKNTEQSESFINNHKQDHGNTTGNSDLTVSCSSSGSPTIVSGSNSESPTSSSTVKLTRFRSRKRQSGSFCSQRKSSRKVQLSDSRSTSSPSLGCESLLPLLVGSERTSAKKRVIVSSVFQCLVDEGKRRHCIEEFAIPQELIQNSYKTHCSDTSLEETNVEAAKDKNINRLMSREIDENSKSETVLVDEIDAAVETGDIVSDSVVSKAFTSDFERDKWLKKETNDGACYREINEKLSDATLLMADSNKVLVESKSASTSALIKQNDILLSKNITKDMPVNISLSCVRKKINREHLDQLDKDVASPTCTLFDWQSSVVQEGDVQMSAQDLASVLVDGKHSDADTSKGDVANSNPVVNEVESSIVLQQMACFEIEKSDQLQWMSCVEVEHEDGHQPYMYIVCLCSACLKLFTVCNNQWTCVANSRLGFTTKKKLGQVMYILPDSDNVSVILLNTMTNCTSVNLYVHFTDVWKHEILCKVFSKSIQVCPLSWRCLVIGYNSDQRSYLTKYSRSKAGGEWYSVQLESTDKVLTSLMAVTGINAAFLALMKSAELQIWNHEQGYLLTCVDLSDLCPLEPLCSSAFSEQGFLFLPVFSRKKGCDAGTVIVANPFLGTSETLMPIQCTDLWTGCSNVCMMSEGLLLCRQNNGCLRMWDVCSGDLLATINDVTCFTSSDQYLLVAHKQCVHVYQLQVTHPDMKCA